MSEPKEPTPVRAWVERAAWSQYLQWDEKAGRFIRVSVPTGGDRELGVNWQGYRSIPDAISEGAWGPINSLWVLFDTGHEIEVYWDEYGPSDKFRVEVFDRGRVARPVVLAVYALTDTEAVEGALVEAAYWIGAQEEER